MASKPNVEHDFEGCARLLPGAVAGQLFADSTPFAVDGFAEVLRWIETINSHDYWVIRWTALLDRTDNHPQHNRGADVRAKLDAVSGVVGTSERMAFIERLAARQGLPRPQGREIARVARQSEEALERCLRISPDGG